jgi:hypothetical protein
LLARYLPFRDVIPASLAASSPTPGPPPDDWDGAFALTTK